MRPTPPSIHRSHNPVKRDFGPGRLARQVAGVLPPINTSRKQVWAIVKLAWAAGLAANDPPSLFRFGTGLAEIVVEEGVKRLRQVTLEIMLGLLIRWATWWKQGEKDLIDTRPPRDVAVDCVVNPDPRLPRLNGIVTSPVLTMDGRIVREPGFDAASGLYYTPSPGFEVAPVPPVPTADEVAAARDLLLEDALGDFPFSGPSDRAHALAALLTLFAREAIDGPLPLVLIDASSAGSGKGLLVDVFSIAHSGGRAIITTYTDSDGPETRRKITSILLYAPRMVTLDNVGSVDSSDLAALATSETWTDRPLRESKMLILPNRAMWVLTANNGRLSTELARRTIRIRLVPRQERPWERTGFRHPNLRSWILAERPRLVWSVLVLLQNWLALGRPLADVTLGSFESWARTLGGILEAAGVEGFLADRHELYEAVDAEAEQWNPFIAAWHRIHGDATVTVAQLVELASSSDSMPGILGDGGVNSRRARLGKALSAQRDRIVDGFRIEAVRDSRTKTNRYRLAGPPA